MGKTVGCIVVRMKSTRLPKKALADIAGKSMIERLILRMKTCSALDRIVICTSTHPDDRVLGDIATRLGIGCFMGSEDNVLSRLSAVADSEQADRIIRITGDNLFTCPNILDQLLRNHRALGVDYARVEGLPLGVTAEVMAVSMLGKLKELIPSPLHTEYMMLYAYAPEHFRCLVMDPPHQIKRPNYSLTIDTPEDLALARRIYADCPHSPQSDPTIGNVIAFLDTCSGYKAIPSEQSLNMPDGAKISYAAFLAMMEGRAQKAASRIPLTLE